MSAVPEISAAYARLILQSGIADVETLMQGVSLSVDEIAGREFIALSELKQLYRNFNALAPDASWTARMGQQFSIGAHGPLGFAALSAPTLGDALNVIAELTASRYTAIHATTYATDSHYVLAFEDTSGEEDFGRWMVEVLLKIFEELLAALLGHPVGKNVSITFAHSAPPDASALCDIYQSQVRFDSPENSISVPWAWRSLPSPLYDEALYRANVIKCREIIAQRQHSQSIAYRVHSRLAQHFDRQLLREAEPTPPPTLDQVADEFHLSPRTLIRQLHRDSHSFKQILENKRRDYAQELLRDARLSVADIAELLGYREAANFSRAFRRWFGCSPAAWRRQ